MNRKVFISISTTFAIVLIVSIALFLFQDGVKSSQDDKVFKNKIVTTTKKGEKRFSKDFSNVEDNIDQFSGKIATTSFSNYKEAQEVSSTIKEVVQQGPTFAGKYAVATYVCGKECQKSTIVNLNTGEIIAEGLRSVYNIAYRLNSRLLKVNPKKNLPENRSKIKSGIATSYYVLEDDDLRFIGKQNLNSEKDKACSQVVTGAENVATGNLVYFPSPCDVPKYNWKEKR